MGHTTMQAMSSQSSAEPNRQAEPKEFLALVDELDIAADGRSLERPARLKCLEAHLSCPRGFANVVRRSIQEADRNPIGLCLWALGRNEHKKAARRRARRRGRRDPVLMDRSAALRSEVSQPLPQLLDAKHLAAELAVTRAAAEKIMVKLPIVQVPGLRKVYVRRPDVEKLLEACTFAKDEIPT
jgi:hypothetical protein